MAKYNIACARITSQNIQRYETINGGDLGEILARITGDRCLMPRMRQSFTVFRLRLSLAGESTSSFLFVPSSFLTRIVSAIKIAAEFLGMRYSPASMSHGFSYYMWQGALWGIKFTVKINITRNFLEKCQLSKRDIRYLLLWCRMSCNIILQIHYILQQKLD